VEVEEKEKEPEQLSRAVRIYLAFQHLLTALFSLVIIIVMVLTLLLHSATSTDSAMWSQTPNMTPTYVMLAMAVLTGVADVIVLFAQCCSGRTAKRAAATAAGLRKFGSILQTVLSTAAAAYFKVSKNNSNGSDLWGGACDLPDGFTSVCQSNTASYILAILQAVLQVLSILIPIIALYKPGQKNSVVGNIKDSKELYGSLGNTVMEAEGEKAPPAN